MFRAIRKDGQGEVKGWLFVRPLPKLMCFILEDSWTELTGWRKESWQFGEVEVIPSTIAMKTYQLDKAKEMIYGSFNLEGFGMTKGGDVIECRGQVYSLIFSKYGYWTSIESGSQQCLTGYLPTEVYEIIGKQYDKDE